MVSRSDCLARRSYGSYHTDVQLSNIANGLGFALNFHSARFGGHDAERCRSDIGHAPSLKTSP